MRNFGEDPPIQSLAGSLLVAHPNLLDPNFRRTVLFISAHDPAEGALGLIINRPLDRHVADLVTETPPAGRRLPEERARRRLQQAHAASPRAEATGNRAACPSLGD